MAVKRLWIVALVLAACGPSVEPASTPQIEIKPQDFALVPCGPGRAERPCALAVAGGKRILFGAPAGVGATLLESDLAQLDAVILFSLHAADIEGLDEVRNASWRAGRSEPLLVIGPEGTSVMASALNGAYEQADALLVVEEGMPPGGYDAAVLIGRDVARDALAFDTGDVKVRVISGGVYSVEYSAGVTLTIQACVYGAEDDFARVGNFIPEPSLGCSPISKWQWPLTETVFMVKNE